MSIDADPGPQTLREGDPETQSQPLSFQSEADKKVLELAHLQEASDKELGLDSLPEMDRDTARSELIAKKQSEQRKLNEAFGVHQGT